MYWLEEYANVTMSIVRYLHKSTAAMRRKCSRLDDTLDRFRLYTTRSEQLL